MNQEISKTICAALADSEEMCCLLDPDHIFDDTSDDQPFPCITIGHSQVQDPCLGNPCENEAIVTLQVWPQTGEKGRAEEFMTSVHHALMVAGLLNGKHAMTLRQEFSGTRCLPDNHEFQGILRYRAICRNQAS